jgi:hypothetical protein
MNKRLILGILYTGFGKKEGRFRGGAMVGGVGGAVRLRLLLLLPCHGGGDDSLQLTLQQKQKCFNNTTRLINNIRR